MHRHFACIWVGMVPLSPKKGPINTDDSQVLCGGKMSSTGNDAAIISLIYFQQGYIFGNAMESEFNLNGLISQSISVCA